MSDKHISFDTLEFGDPVDEAHLQNCERCRERMAAFRFLAYQVRQAPDVSVPPFFAQRVAQLARRRGLSFLAAVPQIARWAIPVFGSLVLLVTFLAYRDTSPHEGDFHSELLFELSVQEEISLHYVLDSLVEFEEDTQP